MPADYIQLLGTDVPDSYGGCCFSGQIQHESLRYRGERMTPESLSAEAAGEKEREGPMCSDGELLLFNCPEGTQRFSSEANIRLVRVRGFFFTRWAASTVMGMPGLLFTINDAGVRHANFFGPSSSGGHVVESSTVPTQQATLVTEEGGKDATAGLAGMLEELRRQYFCYRQMSFQQLRAGVVMRQLATPLSWNYICEVPLPPAEVKEDDDNDHDAGVSGSGVRSGVDRSSSSFFVLALLLSPTSALLGFRVSGDTKTPADSTYGYAIVHAPAATFDPHRAKSLGVLPGPMYGQLKQGVGVWVEDVQRGTGGEKAAPTRRFVHPQSVKQMTQGSLSMFVSLVLDGDSCDDVAVAMELLFGCDETIKREDGQWEQRNEDGHFPHAHQGKKCGGELRRVLARWQPSLLYCDDHAESVANTARLERSVVLVHVVHVQCAQFFREMGVGNLSQAQGHYTRSIFARVRRDIRMQALGLFCSPDSPNFAEGATTEHYFCAAVQKQFSAFPTALAHRYHLNSIAPGQFPITHAPSEGVSGKEKGPVWPYAVKHPLIPSTSTTPVVDGVHGPSPTSIACIHTVSPGAVASSVTNETARKRNMTELLWYPTPSSALAMLSEKFRATVVASCRLLENSPPFLPQVTHHDGGGALTFLGTGSAVPSKYRNVSGTYLEVMYHSHQTASICRAVVVLDFGEGSLGQLAMLWGSDYEEVQRRFVEDLAFVFISHAHADHHLGLLSLLELRHRVLLANRDSSERKEEPLLVVCPQEVHEFLLYTWGSCTSYSEWLREEVFFEVIPAERFRNDGAQMLPVFLPRLDALCQRLHNNTVVVGAGSGGDVENDGVPPRTRMWACEVFPVHHPANAHGLLLRFPALGGDGTSRVMLFSGDTRPSSFLIERCRNFTAGSHREGGLEEMEQELFLCLHEATFGEGCEDEAVRKCHSTLPEALQVAAAIHARHIVLNHFSQRYPKLPGLMKSQLDGIDVDLHCRRRKLPPSDGTTSSTNVNDVDFPNLGTEPDGNKQQHTCLSSPDVTCAAGAREMCFGFDFMRLTFASLETQQAARLTPVFVQLLQEYESWGAGTTKRLRS